MFGIIRIAFIVLILLSGFTSAPHAVGAIADKSLVTINGQNHTAEDFISWWQNWREPETTLPENPDDFIEWQLLVGEAKTMELFREPSFQHKVDIFLKSRTLLLLKNEVVDSRIKISEDDLRTRYNARYSPRTRIQILYFNDPEKAAATHKALKGGVLTINDFRGRTTLQGSDVYFQEKTFRPQAIAEPWQGLVAGLAEGDITSPSPLQEGYVIVVNAGQIGFEQEDFDKLRDGLRTEIWKEQQAELTRAMLEDLKKRYQVKVDEELLAKFDPEKPPESLTDRPMVQTNKVPVTEKQFAELYRQELARRQSYGIKEERNPAEIKQWLLDSMLSQNLTNWAALDRHFEEEPPFKSIYTFYTQHRLIKELEARLFMAQARVSPAEVAAYYDEHRQDYSAPDVVSLGLYIGEPDQAKKIWSAVSLGADFLAAVEKYTGSKEQIQDLRVNELAPEVRDVVANLAKGELSAIFKTGGKSAVVKLVNRQPGETQPLEQAGGGISSRLQEGKLTKLRAAYVAELKGKSQIKMNRSVWNAVRKELSQKEEK
ncbi:MAG: hypothetical protein A2521_08760 [Deltaproteobacteria bacterium RIFOXYD12_FULL_57_12]|nr:MAG: hypothetical protein A2521_08760 [Deltaproteobacteria bacterium RIFOXYD12_FULL_57_12]